MMSRLACLLFTALAMAQQLPQSPQAPLPDATTLATVDGIIVGPNHVPLAGTAVMLIGVTGLSANGGVLGAPYDATADSGSRFSIRDVEPGSYGVIATHPPDYAPLDSDLSRITLTGSAAS
jgi:hypothetical protein